MSASALDKIHNREWDFILKFILLGNASVGKSSILRRYAGKGWEENYFCTIGVDFEVKDVMIDGNAVKLMLWDTAGQERFRTIVQSYFRGAHGAVLVYDITDRESFIALRKWQGMIENMGVPGSRVAVVGNKLDLASQRVVDRAEGEAFAQALGDDVIFVETSAKHEENVDRIFSDLASQLTQAGLGRTGGGRTPPGTGGFRLPDAVPVDQQDGGYCAC